MRAVELDLATARVEGERHVHPVPLSGDQATAVPKHKVIAASGGRGEQRKYDQAAQDPVGRDGCSGHRDS